MSRSHRALLVLPLLAALGGAACDSSPAASDCAQPTLTRAGADITLRARVTVPAQGAASVRVALGGAEEATLGLVRLAEGQSLALYRPLAQAAEVGAIDEATAVPLDAPAEACGVGEYAAEVAGEAFRGGEGPGGLVLRLTEGGDGGGLDARRELHGGGATPGTTPAEVVVGEPFDVELDRDLPTISGASWAQQWDLELRGDCLVPAPDDADPRGPKDFAYAVDEDQVGSDQRPTTGGRARFRVPAEALAAGSSGCEVAATFVVTTTSAAGGAPTTIPGTAVVRVEAAPFTFQLRRAGR